MGKVKDALDAYTKQEKTWEETLEFLGNFEYKKPKFLIERDKNFDLVDIFINESHSSFLEDDTYHQVVLARDTGVITGEQLQEIGKKLDAKSAKKKL